MNKIIHYITLGREYYIIFLVVLSFMRSSDNLLSLIYYVFFILIVLIEAFNLLKIRKSLVIHSIIAYRGYLLLLVIYFVWIILSEVLNIQIKKDFIVGIAYLFPFLVLLTIPLKTSIDDQIEVFMKSVFCISVISIFLIFFRKNVFGSTEFNVDYNFLALNLVFGLIALLYLFYHKLLRINFFVLQTFILLFIISIFLTHSRRGFISLIIMIIICGVILVRKQELFLVFHKILYMLVLLFSLFISIIIVYMHNEKFKDYILKNVQKDTIDLIALYAYRYNSIFTSSSYGEFFFNNFSRKYDKNDASTWVTTRKSFLIKLSEMDSLIQPLELRLATGYLINHSSKTYSWGGNAYSFVPLGTFNLKREDTLSISVYCFSSHNFNGEWFRIITRRPDKDISIITYNEKEKGRWQKLNDTIKNVKGSITPYMFIKYKNDTTLEFLEGYSIFALPIVKINNSDANLNYNNLVSTNKFYFNKPAQFNRLNRWQYFYKIFASYSLSEKLTGRGFNYTSSYAAKFNTDEYDYPHNIFLSTILYSGLLGGFIYLYFMSSVIFFYVKKLKDKKVLAFMFFLVLFFSFFSGNSHFSIPILSVFSLIPTYFKQINSHVH